MIQRRQFVTLLGSAAAWPFAAHAQQDRRRLVGVVAGFSEPEMRPQITALRSKPERIGMDRESKSGNRRALECGRFPETNGRSWITCWPQP
jgi:hypothetical protein